MMFSAAVYNKHQQGIDPVAMLARDGMQRIPEAMSAHLKRDVMFDRAVTSIRSDKDGVDVHCLDGSLYRARFVLCSVPIPALRQIRFDPLLSGVQEQGIKTVASLPVTQLHLIPKSRFWENDGLAPHMWTDGPAGFVMPNRLGDAPEEITSLTVWARGLRALYLDRLGREQAKKAVVNAIEEFRPAARGQLEVAHLQAWGQERFTGGIVMNWGPGEITKYHGRLWAPHERIHFCGEHTSTLERGMEGAMESGERAAVDLLERI
jgi:monoamine oxidase